MNSHHRAATTVLMSLLVVSVISFAGCGHDAGEHAAAAHDKAAEAVHGAKTDATAALTPAAREAAIAKVLMAADAIDGTTDKVVTHCPGCSLAMEGKAEHAHTVGEYELHFCSASCSDHFNTDTEASLLALQGVLDKG